MKHIITNLFFLLPTLLLGQSFNFKQIKIQSIDSLRKVDKSKTITYSYPIGVSSDYFPNRQQFVLAQPIIYGKKIKKFKNENSFYYSMSDSIVRLIEYQWEGTKKATDKQFFEIADRNKQIISNFFNAEPQEIPETETKAAKSIWENQFVYVQQLIMPGLQRIRILVSWK